MTNIDFKFAFNGDENIFRKNVEKYDHSKALSSAAAPCSILDGQLINFDAQKKEFDLNPHYPAFCLEMIESDKWIKKYGLVANKLTFENILSMIGFKKQQDYMDQVKKIVASQYSKGLFLQTQSKDGFIYNITVNVNKLIDFANRLEDSIKMFKLRLRWLNSDSRRLFGIVTEHSVCLVVDCKTRDPIKFSQYKNCIIKLLKEQIAKISSFNLIRCSDKIEFFREKAVVVSAQTIEDSIEWLNEWNREFVKVSPDTVTCESVMLAFKDKTIEAIYLISQGLSSNGVRELLFEKSVKLANDLRTCLNVVSFDCIDSETVEYLRRLALNAKGRFHAYCLLKQYEDYIPGPIDPDPTKSQIIMNKRVFGGAPPGSGVKTDLMLIFEEIQSAMETLENLRALIDSMNRAQDQKIPTKTQDIKQNKTNKNRDEEYLTSKEWLEKHGLFSKNLDLFDVLNKVCFRHCDGVVDIKKEPITGKCFFLGEGVRYYQGDAIPSSKLVNAKYCDQFAHVLWNDGTIMHVHVTPELHRSYEQKITIYLQLYEKRIDWLSKGSRELFGTVIENNICILIDTSQSMQLSLDFVKRKLQVLMQEQLKSKQRFNLIAFNSKIFPWRDRMVEVDEFNIKSALDWIKGLNAQGTTNTLTAIRFALSDLNTEAIYLLSDGRPDQEPRQILSQVHLNTRIPIHTISFNCNDSEANKFLSKLAEETKGRYHYFNESGWDADPNGPIPYQSEDISLLKKEIDKGQKYLQQMSILREECAKLSIGNKNNDNNKILTRRSLDSNSETKIFQSKYRSKTSFEKSKFGFDVNNGVLNALHDINSLEWVLPETRALLERQFRKQMSANKEESKQSQNIKPRKSSPKKNKRPITVDINMNNYSKFSKWLEKNSLSALKLTIFDALLKSEQESDTNLLVDELFNAKIWSDIMEYAERSKIDKAKFKLVNPSKIDWYTYESKLDDQIRIYKKYLSDSIWSSLPDHEKIILNLKTPVDYFSHKTDLTKALEYSNWPVKKSDIELFENEIDTAMAYRRFASELNEYFNEKSSQEKEMTNKDEDVPDTNRDNQDKKISDVNKSLKNFVKKKENFSIGDKVIAGSSKKGYYYDGKITKVIDSAHYNVKFDNGFVQTNMLFNSIIKKNDTSPYFSVGDYIMARVINEFEQACWVPGIIQTIDTVSTPKVFLILFFNGQQGQNSRVDLIKIDKSVYGYAVNYIKGQIGDKNSILSGFSEQSSKPGLNEDKNENSNKQDKPDTIEIVDQIKSHIDALNLDKKYKKMFDEITKVKKRHSSLQKNIKENYQELRDDIDQWKETIPQMIKKIEPKIKSPIPIDKTPSPINRKPKKRTSTDLLIDLRKKLPDLMPGESVLARWSDDNWYYLSKIRENLGDFKYIVEDNLGDNEEIYRENIISFRDDLEPLEKNDTVIAAHPDYLSSYAPGQIIAILNDANIDRFIVKFYDFAEFEIQRDQIFKIPLFKYHKDIEEITEKELKLIGKSVIVRNSNTKLYELGTVLGRTGNGKKYTIKLSNGEEIVSDIIHMFGQMTKIRNFQFKDFILAPRDGYYLPGQVLKTENNLTVRFIDGKEISNIDVKKCFYLSKGYFQDATKFYKSKVNFNESSEEDDDQISGYQKLAINKTSIPIISAKDVINSPNESLKSYK